MLRLFLALNILILNLFACKGGYESCKLKITHSKTIKNQTLRIPVLKNKRVIFSRQTPSSKIIKYDPFLSLYLVEDSNRFKHPFKINNHLSLGIASVDIKRAIEGVIVKRQVGLNTLATFSEALYTPALLLNSCCALEGLVTSNGIIQKKFVERFINSKSSDYGDVGIRVEDKKGLVLVKSVNPFVKDNPFKKGDCIIELDSIKIKNSAILMRRILFSKIGSSHKLKIKRDAKFLTFNIKIKKRYGGGYISDTFLEHRGIYFNKDLTILRITNRSGNYGLKAGDKLIQVNGKKINNIKDIANYMNSFEDLVSLLFQRDGFQFFININPSLTTQRL